MPDKQLQIIEQESTQLVEQAKKQEVKNQMSYDSSANFLKTCINMKKRIELFFDPTIKKFKEAKKVADEGRKAELERMDVFLAPISDAILIIKKKCKAFEDEQEEVRKKEQARLDAEAEKKAKDDKKALEEQAKTDKEWGDNEAAEENTKAAEEVEAEKVKAKPVIAKTSGLGIRRKWDWELVDFSKVPREFLLLDRVKINAFVRENEDNKLIPGITVKYE